MKTTRTTRKSNKNKIVMAIVLTIAFASFGCSFLSLFGEQAPPPATPTTTMVATRLPTATGTLPVLIGTVAVGNLNLRDGPSDDYEILLVMHEGDEVIVLGMYQTSDEEIWARVSFKKTIGYCNYDYITAP